jgi:hypothetical protein
MIGSDHLASPCRLFTDALFVIILLLVLVNPPGVGYLPFRRLFVYLLGFFNLYLTTFLD